VIYSIGKVTKPGPYPLAPGMTVMQALSAAGGFAEWADPKNILIVRKEGERRFSSDSTIRSLRRVKTCSRTSFSHPATRL